MMNEVIVAAVFSVIAAAALAQTPPQFRDRSPFHTQGDGPVANPPVAQRSAPVITRTMRHIMICKLTTPVCDELNARVVIKKTPADNIVCGPKAFVDLKVSVKDDERFEMQCDAKK